MYPPGGGAEALGGGLERIVAAGCVKTLATYAFPSNDTAVNVQFQAVAGLRGLAAHDTIRIQMMEDGVLEPLMLIGAAPCWVATSLIFGWALFMSVSSGISPYFFVFWARP